MNKSEMVKEILSGMTYKEEIRNGIWINENKTYQEFFHHVHGDMLPDDFRYKMIHDILCGMTEYDDIEDIDSLEILDALIPIYNNDLLQWVSGQSRYTFVDDAISEYGYPEEGFIKSLQYGYMMELEEVYGLILGWIEDNTEKDE